MMNSGYDIEKRSCRKPGTVISSVRIQPPATAFRSSTQTRLPLRTSIAAQTSELMPLPTITTSNVSMSASRSPGVLKRRGPCHGDRRKLVVQTADGLTRCHSAGHQLPGRELADHDHRRLGVG